MAENLLKESERCLGETLEGAFSLPVRLIDPSGVTHIYAKNSTTRLIRGQVVLDTLKRSDQVDTEYFGDIFVQTPSVTLRRSSLPRVPANGEFWVVQIPQSLDDNPEYESYMLESPKTDINFLGIITLYLKQLSQESD